MEETSSYLYLFEEFEERKQVATLKEISYSSEFKFGSEIKIVKRKLPFDVQKFNTVCNTVVLISNLKIDDNEIVVKIHFYKRRLVFFKYEFTNLKDVSKIENLIKEKYLNPDFEIDLMSHYIKDSFGNFLFLDKKNKNEITVSYFTENYGFFDHAVELDNLINDEKERDAEDNIGLLSKL